MNLQAKVRQLARSSYWQTLYRNSKECNGINLFLNKDNFSGIQTEFLYWLSVYNMLYEELSKHESVYLTEKVIDSDVRTDAYLYYRSKKINYDWKQHQLKIQQEEKAYKRKRKFSEGKQTDIEVDLRRA